MSKNIIHDLKRADGKKLVMSAHYQKAGMNFATYKPESGGFFVTFKLADVSENCISYELFGKDSFKMLALEATRNNAKKIEQLEIKIQEKSEELARLFVEDRNALVELVKTLL